MTYLLVCGDRYWPESDRVYLNRILDAFDEEYRVRMLIEGEAPGADTMARQWAERRGITVAPFPANWKRYGKAAGPIRNQQMLVEGKPDYGLAFHRQPESSRGSKDMVSRLSANGTPVWWVPFEGVRPYWSPLP